MADVTRAMNFGEESGTLVMDLGTRSFRIGYALDNGPKMELPTVVGVLKDGVATDAGPLEIGNSIHDNSKYFVDVTSMWVPRKDVEVMNCMIDGMVEDWDMFEKLLDYTYDKCLQINSKYHPVLFSETPFNTNLKREQLAELMFEKYNIPAIFIGKNAVLAAFSTGRSSALVVDSGASHTSVIPILDGYAITYASVKSPLGGDFITMKCKEYFQKNAIDVIPHYLIKEKQVVSDREIPIWTKKKELPKVTSSWHDYMSKLVVQDFQHTVLQVSDRPYDEKVVAGLPTYSYEFPEGYNQEFGSERFRIPETLFNPSAYLGSSLLGVCPIINTSVGLCDADIRSMLYSNIILIGGNTLLRNYTERLHQELSASVPPSMKLNITATNNSVERRFGSWIGGSITASSEVFQGIWLSIRDYRDRGNLNEGLSNRSSSNAQSK